MAKQKAGKALTDMAERLFMRNGSSFVVRFVSSERSQAGARTIYRGASGIFLGEVNEAEVAVRVSLTVPERRESTSEGPRLSYPAGGFEVSGYKF